MLTPESEHKTEQPFMFILRSFLAHQLVRHMAHPVQAYCTESWSGVFYNSGSEQQYRKCCYGTKNNVHKETKILPVKKYNIMLNKRFLLGCHRRMSTQRPHHTIRDYSKSMSEKIFAYMRKAQEIIGFSSSILMYARFE